MVLSACAAIIAKFLLIATPALSAEVSQSGYVETAPGVSIYYEQYGDGPQTVFIPNRLFMPEMRELAHPERTLILYDMRNRGSSRRVEDESTINIMADVEDLEALRRHFGAERMSLVGYSYLGLMVALYAIEHPERVERFVQIGPVPREFGTAYPQDQTADASSLSPEGLAAAAAWREVRSDNTVSELERCRAFGRYVSFLLVGDPANADQVPDTCVYENELYDNQMRHLNAHFTDIQSRDFSREPFTELTHPVLTIHGTLDRNAPYGSGLEWATTFRNGRLITVEGGAHQVWLDDPSVLEDIHNFLVGNWSPRAQRFGRE